MKTKLQRMQHFPTLRTLWLTFLCLLATATWALPETGHTYQIVTADGLALSTGGYTDNNKYLLLEAAAITSVNQHWEIEAVGDYFALQSIASGKGVDQALQVRLQVACCNGPMLSPTTINYSFLTSKLMEPIISAARICSMYLLQEQRGGWK